MQRANSLCTRAVYYKLRRSKLVKIPMRAAAVLEDAPTAHPVSLHMSKD